MDFFIALIFKPLVMLVFFILPMAIGLWAARKFMPDGRLKKFLLREVGVARTPKKP